MVMGFIDLALWPNYAGKVLRRKLAETTRALAVIPRHAARQAWGQAGAAALAVHGQIAGALILYNEGQLEFGSREADDETARHRALDFINGQEEVFCALLVVLRHRRAMNHEALSSVWQQRLQALDETIAQRLEALADPPGRPTGPDPGRLLAEFIEALPSPTAPAKSHEIMQRQLSEYALVGRELVDAVQRLALLPAAPLTSELTAEVSRVGRICKPT
jgi:hypothetical protein